jgi:hypothetical protein
MNDAQSPVWKAKSAVGRLGRGWSSRRQPLVERPYSLVGTTGTLGSAGKDELTLEAEKRPLKRYLPIAIGPIWLDARYHP